MTCLNVQFFSCVMQNVFLMLSRLGRMNSSSKNCDERCFAYEGPSTSTCIEHRAIARWQSAQMVANTKICAPARNFLAVQTSAGHFIHWHIYLLFVCLFIYSQMGQLLFLRRWNFQPKGNSRLQDEQVWHSALITYRVGPSANFVLIFIGQKLKKDFHFKALPKLH